MNNSDYYRFPRSHSPRSRSSGRLFLLLVLLMLAALAFSWVMEVQNPKGPQYLHQIWKHVSPLKAQAAAADPLYQIDLQAGGVVGGPTLSPLFINRVLALAHSPAQGTGQTFYDLSKQYQIDDAFALATFRVESQYGTTGVARETRSLGNIRCAGAVTCIQGYRSYASWSAGYTDWYQLIRTQYVNTWHLTTVAQIVPVEAPANDGNNPGAYIAAVTQAEHTWWSGKAVE
jgi:hypothetical protein